MRRTVGRALRADTAIGWGLRGCGAVRWCSVQNQPASPFSCWPRQPRLPITFTSAALHRHRRSNPSILRHLHCLPSYCTLDPRCRAAVAMENELTPKYAPFFGMVSSCPVASFASCAS